MSPPRPAVSVLICTYNRPALLRRCLAALLDGTTEKPGQVVVVNGGDARTDALVGGYLGRVDVEVRLIKTVNKNLAASRNVGLPYCTGEIVAMTDDDAEVFPDWLTAIRRAFAAYPDAGAVGGAVIGAGPPTLITRLADQVTFPQPARPGPVRTLPGVNLAYRRAALDAVGLQDETLFRGEDVDFNWRIIQAGYRIYFDPALRIMHHHRPTLRRFIQQHYMYGRAYYLVRRKWPEMYCVYPHGIQTLRDVLRLVYFGLSPFYLALGPALKIRPLPYTLAAYLVQVGNQFAWRLGMCRQWLGR